LLERGAGLGGATSDSAGWLWRARSEADAVRWGPGGDPDVHRAVVGRLDAGLAWLVQRGVELRARDTGRTFTRGARVDPGQALEALAAMLPSGVLRTGQAVCAAARGDDGSTRLGLASGEEVEVDAVVLAGGGYAADLDRVAADAGAPRDSRDSWVLRTERGGDGTALDLGVALGAELEPSGGACLVKPVPLGVEVADRRLLAGWGELVTPGARILLDPEEEVVRADHDWSGAAASWEMARRAGWCWLDVPRADLALRMHSGTVQALLDLAVEAGARVSRTDDGGLRIAMVAGITTTLGGLRVDGEGRTTAPGVFAAGGDSAGAGRGGAASGLAQALVLGRSAGDLAASDDRCAADRAPR
ncbi:MAG: fumarate reductase/succinate dehydrogenase flavoprotein-like protein, partial [Thermoleophilia bacterium]|nr:fumarate reductase/succinate dehydrogenase flavoprotein-like protein [Thermoleophilia bacterium]